MTPTAALLLQSPALRRRACEHTRDTNEAYLMVHNVMVRALGGADGEAPELALARAIDKRANCSAIAAAPT